MSSCTKCGKIGFTWKSLPATATMPDGSELKECPGCRVGHWLAPGAVLDITAPIRRQDMDDLIEKDVVRIHMNWWDYSDLRKFGRDIIEIETDPVELAKGRMSSIKGRYIYASKTVPKGTIFVTRAQDGDDDLKPGWNPDPAKAAARVHRD